MLDEFSLEQSTTSTAAVEHYYMALENYLASSTATMPRLEQALAADPCMPMAILFRAYLLKLSADPRFRQAVDDCFHALEARTDLSEREQRHLKALDYWRKNDMTTATETFDAIVMDYPRDILALRVAHYLHFYGAGAGPMIKSLQPALANWQTNDKFYGYLQGMLSFALEESGQYADAEKAGRAALEINPGDIWAGHAVTHIMQMQSRFSDGLRLIASLSQNWQDANNFVNHLHWHTALLHLGQDDTDAALAIYDQRLIEPLGDDFYLDICNAASLLWRLEIRGVDAGSRWEALMSVASPRVADDELVFSTLHYLMVPTRLKNEAVVNQCLTHFERWVCAEGSQAEVARKVGKPLAEAIQRISDGHEASGAEQIKAIQKDIHLIGGSHAQRALFTEIMKHYS